MFQLQAWQPQPTAAQPPQRKVCSSTVSCGWKGWSPKAKVLLVPCVPGCTTQEEHPTWIMRQELLKIHQVVLFCSFQNDLRHRRFRVGVVFISAGHRAGGWFHRRATFSTLSRRWDVTQTAYFVFASHRLPFLVWRLYGVDKHWFLTHVLRVFAHVLRVCFEMHLCRVVGSAIWNNHYSLT